MKRRKFNSEEERQLAKKEYHEKYYWNNKEKLKLKAKEYYQTYEERIKIYNRNHYQNNKEVKEKYHQNNKAERNLNSKKNYQNNKTERKIKAKEYYQVHKEERNLKSKQYAKNNREKINKRDNNRKKTDINYKLACNLRSTIRRILYNNQKSGSAVRDLGCSIPELKLYLESKFQPEMTWNNWTWDGWHIDHIKPLSKFNLQDREEFLKAVHYTNFQPLWAEENRIKSNNYKEI